MMAGLHRGPGMVLSLRRWSGTDHPVLSMPFLSTEPGPFESALEFGKSRY